MPLTFSLSCYSIVGRARGEDEEGRGGSATSAPSWNYAGMHRPAIECINAGALPPPHCFLACYSLAIVEDGDANLDGEAGGPVEAVPGGVGGGAGVSLERDVWSHRRGWRTWLWGGPG